MKSALIFYSWSGHTRSIATEKARKEGFELFEVKAKKRPRTLAAYTAGCLAAMRMKRTPIQPLNIPFEDFEHIAIMAPVWAGHPAPAINSVFDQLPSGCNVSVIMVSGSGSSRCRDKLGELVRARGCKFTGYTDIKG